MTRIDKKNIEKFYRNGYLIVDDVFNNNEMNQLSQAVKAILVYKYNYLLDKNNKKGINITESNILKSIVQEIANIDRREFDNITESICHLPEFLRMISKKNIQKISNILMNQSIVCPLYGYINRCRINLPKDKNAEAGWHREIFQTIPRANFIQIWAPLFFNSSFKNGTIEFCKSSHNIEFSKPKWQGNKNGTAKIFLNENKTKKYKNIRMNLKVGQAVFFNGKILHRSGNNTSNSPRYSMVGLYHNIKDKNFFPPKATYSYLKETPQEYFNSVDYF